MIVAQEVVGIEKIQKAESKVFKNKKCLVDLRKKKVLQM